LAAVAAAGCLGAMHASAADIVYQDHFDNDGLDTNTGIGGGAASVDTTPVEWSVGMWDDNGNLTSTGGNWGGTSANAYSLNGFDLRNGFKLEVTYNIVNAQSRLTIGLVDEAGADSPDIAVIPTSGTLSYHGIFFNPVAYDSKNRFPDAPGLQFSDGTNPRQRLSNDQTNGAGGTHTLVLEMDPASNWSYSVDEAAPTTGTIGGAGFDLTPRYRFVVRNQVSSQANNIQSVTLSTTLSKAPFPLIITPNDENPGNYDFEWPSQAGKLYDLVSDTVLSTSISTWPVWDGRTNLPPDGATTTLTNVPGGPDLKRFFAVVEKSPPPLLEEGFETGDGGFTLKTTGGSFTPVGSPWAHGDPDSTGGGGTVSTGNGGSTHCWGTDIGSPGLYANPTETCLRSTVIDLTGVAAAQLTFAEALDLEAGDTAVVNLIDDTTDAVIAAAIYTAVDGDITNADWAEVPAINLAAGVGRRVRIEWCFSGQAPAADYMGWYIDDVVVSQGTATFKSST
jgi:hypothetical protein